MIASNADVKEWLLIGDTFVLALLTLRRWPSTRSTATATTVAARSVAEAATATSRSTEIATPAPARERWSVEMCERRRVRARLMQVDRHPVAVEPGPDEDNESWCHISHGRRRSRLGGGSALGLSEWGHGGPGEVLEVTFDRLTPLTDTGGAQACMTFTDVDKRRWIRRATDDPLVHYDCNPAALFAERPR